MTLDVPNAFIQTGILVKRKGERIIMKIRGKLVDWLLKLDPGTYSSYVVFEKRLKFAFQSKYKYY